MNIMMRFVTALIAMLFASAASASREDAANKQGQTDEPGFGMLTEYITAAMDDWSQPGLGVVIVDDGRVIFQQGFGVRSLETKTPVTEDTVFGIASLSKSFAAASIGLLVDQGKLDWDDPVIKHLPEFRMPREVDTLSVTIRDLLSMRTGISSAEHTFRRINSTRKEHVGRIQHLEQRHPLRSEYLYTTDTFTVAGEIVARVSGAPWEEYVRKNLWRPAGMTDTNGDHKRARLSENAATPHIQQGDAKQPVAWVYEDYAALPAGGVNTTPKDYGKWLLTHLNGGRLGGKQIIPEGVLEEILTPHTPMRGSFDGDNLQRLVGGGPNGVEHSAYALGWMVYDYRGYKAYRHGGGIDGFKSQVMFIPEENFGVAVFANADDYAMPMSIAQSIVDWKLGLGFDNDWSQVFLKDAAKKRAMARARTQALTQARQKDAAPSLPLDAFTGSFKDAGAFGDIGISMQDGALVLTAGRARWFLSHWHHDVFRATLDWPYVEDNEHVFVSFQMDEFAAIRGFAMTGAPAPFQRVSASP